MNFKTYCCILKLRCVGANLCGVAMLILKGIKTFWGQTVHAVCWTRIQTLIKTKRNRKWKIPHIIFGRRTFCFSLHKNHRLKVKLWWVKDRKIKRRTFFVSLILSEGNCINICVISVYSVLSTLSEYTYFYLSKTITSYTFLLLFKIVKRLQCILKRVLTSLTLFLFQQFLIECSAFQLHLKAAFRDAQSKKCS